MLLHVWGTDYRRSPSEFRSRLFVPESERPAMVRRWLALGFRDLVYVATCNRIEFYTTARDVYTDTRPLWMELLKTLGLSEDDFYQGYHLEGKSALRHLLRVSTSLESLVVGEPQILGQLKDSIAWVKSEQLPLDSSLERAFSLAFETAKKVRTATAIGEKPISVATLGLRHYVAHESIVAPTRVAVVGRGPISLQVVQWFLKNRPQIRLVWINRNPKRLAEFPESQRVEIQSLEDFIRKPGEFSHLFTATSSREPVFDARFFQQLPNAKRMLFDFAQPPDIDRGAIDSERNVLIHIENLLEEAKANAEERGRAVASAQDQIDAALKQFLLSQKETPVLRDFSSLEASLIFRIDEAMSSLPPGGVHLETEAQRAWLEKILRKNLHDAREHLRKVLRSAAGVDPGDG